MPHSRPDRLSVNCTCTWKAKDLIPNRSGTDPMKAAWTQKTGATK